MTAVSVNIETIGVEKLVAKFEGYDSRLRARLLTAMKMIAFTLVRYIQENKLSGQVLHRRSGTLSRSIRGNVSEISSSIIADITSRDKGNKPLPYAAFWEYGFSGSMDVRSHVRKIASGGFANVRAYTRHVTQAARPFFKPSRDENLGYIKTTIENAVSEVNR